MSKVLLLLLGCVVLGCATEHRTLELDAQHPAVRVSAQGVLFGDRYVKPTEVAEILEDYDIPRDRTIHIRLDPDVKDLKLARFLMACLSRAGYTRPVLVTERHAEALNLGVKKKESGVGRTQPSAAAQPKKIRYKRAND